MRRRSIAVVLATLAAVAVSASVASGCTLLLVSTDGLTGGAFPDAASNPTASGEGGDATGAGGDGGRPTESGVAEAGAGDADAPFCASNPGHAFCDDFDDRVDPRTKWGSTNLQGRGSVSSDATLSRSAPRSYVAQTPAGASVVSVANLDQQLGVSDRLRVAFDVQVTAPSGDVGDSLGTLHFAGGYIDILWFTTGVLRITERSPGKPSLDHDATAPLAAGAWRRLQVDCTPGHIVVLLDDVSVIDAQTTRSYTGASGFSLGLYSEDAESIAFHYDNVLADTVF